MVVVAVLRFVKVFAVTLNVRDSVPVLLYPVGAVFSLAI